MAGLVQFAGWLATQVFDVVGGVAGPQGGGGDDVAGPVDLQVGRTFFHGVPPKMRTELWMSQLQRRGVRSASMMGEYRDLLFETLAPEVLSEIDKDTHRTFPGHPWLSTAEGQQAMLNVLSAYALSDPEIGYTQGMNFITGLLLTYLPGEAEAYAALSLVMRQRGLREMYLPDMRLLQIRLWQLGKLLPPRLAEHLEAHTLLPVLYASSWLLTCFAADFPFHFAARVMDVLLTGHQAASPTLKIAVAIVTRCEKDLMRMEDFEEMVGYLRTEVPRWPRQALQDLLTDALSKPWTSRQLKILDEMNGAETVMEAVARVNNLVQQPTGDAAEADSAAPPEQQGSVAPAAAAAAAAEPVASGEVRGAVQPSPRSVAQTLSTGFAVQPLPPPPAARADAVQWDAWRSELQSVDPQEMRIERSLVGDLVELDPHLSQALSAYPHVDSASPSLAAAAIKAGGPGAEQRLEQQQEQRSPSPRPVAARLASVTPPRQRWDAFASETSRTLQSAPSPFDSSFSGVLPAVSEDTAHASSPPAGGQAAAAAAPALQQAQQPGAEGIGSSSASYGSFQIGSTQASALPLVDLSAVGQAQAQAGGGGGGALNAFLGLFGRAGSPDKPSSTASEYGGDGGSLITDVPSSHGSSLAALLSQLGLGGSTQGGSVPPSVPGSEASGSVHGRPAASLSAAASAGGRQLRHSTEDEFGSFKTAQNGSQGSRGSMPLAPSATAGSSWHSAAERHGSGVSSDRVPHPPARLGSELSSTASSQVPQGGGTPMAAGAAAAAAAAAGAEAQSPSQRAVSLQEQHLAGFLSSGQQQHSRRSRLGERE